jgi:ribosome-binding protein aMBF1 (putative translation factor)
MKNSQNIPAFVAIREERYARLTRDYEKVIREAIADLGGSAALSRALNEQERYIANALNNRGVGSGLKTKRQIALRIAEYYRRTASPAAD